MAVIAICDANILIDYSKSDISIIKKIAEYYEAVCVPDIILQEVGIISDEQAKSLGITIVETPLELEEVPSLSYHKPPCFSVPSEDPGAERHAFSRDETGLPSFPCQQVLNSLHSSSCPSSG